MLSQLLGNGVGHDLWEGPQALRRTIMTDDVRNRKGYVRPSESRWEPTFGTLDGRPLQVNRGIHDRKQRTKSKSVSTSFNRLVCGA